MRICWHGEIISNSVSKRAILQCSVLTSACLNSYFGLFLQVEKLLNGNLFPFIHLFETYNCKNLQNAITNTCCPESILSENLTYAKIYRMCLNLVPEETALNPFHSIAYIPLSTKNHQQDSSQNKAFMRMSKRIRI